MGQNISIIKALYIACTILCAGSFHTAQSQSVQMTTIPVPSPDSVIVVMSRSDYTSFQNRAYNVEPQSFSEWVTLINRVLGLSEGLMSPKEYNQKTAMKAMQLQRKELIKLLRDYNKEKITLTDYEIMSQKHHSIDFKPN